MLKKNTNNNGMLNPITHCSYTVSFQFIFHRKELMIFHGKNKKKFHGGKIHPIQSYEMKWDGISPFH
jgi:hypothetical protein